MEDLDARYAGTVPSRVIRAKDTAVGASILLSALAVAFSLVALWIANRTYERYRDKDLDMPDWFVINMNLTGKVIPLIAAGVICLLISGGLCFVWASRAGWVMRIGFAVQWLMSAVVVALVLWSRLP